MVPASFGCGAVVLAAIATFSPSRAARSAMASPMPRLAPVIKSVLPERLTAPSPRSGVLARTLQLDPVAVGVFDVERAPLALGAVARRRRDDFNAVRCQPRGQVPFAERRERQAEVIDVGSAATGRRRLRRPTQRSVERHQVNETAPRPQLRKTELGLLAFHTAPEDVAVET